MAVSGCYMNEIQIILVGMLVLAASVAYFSIDPLGTNLVRQKITSTEMNVIVSLGVGVLIFIVYQLTLIR